MRIIGGKYRSRNLKAGMGFRPTTDRVRETLFNILQNDVPGSVFVDAFAGSGAVGIEAISRGAAMVYFLEANHKSLRILEENLHNCCIDEKWRICAMDVLRGLEVAYASDPAATIVFLDPPYDYSSYPELLAVSAKLFPAAIIVVESSTRTECLLPEGVERTRQRDIGETRLSFYRSATV